ncbi:MAG: MBL fold metallo-hydrolase [Proteobacteria bacterium]|nr:MBL fold metallo-hydrolase [Pseudomonadota bacterium]MBU1738590.1 MBL fold metallo-hydrolase [Pseudomonadota bacterium]
MGKGEITVEELEAKIQSGKVELLLDMRNPDEFESWRIEGRHEIETMNIPHTDLVGEEEKYLDRLPVDREIIVVCAHGDASAYSAAELRKLGLNARGLVGGMEAWSFLYETTRVVDDPLVIQLYRLAKGCITHLVISDGEAVVIDAVRHIEKIKQLLADHNATLKYVFDTHLQADHISGGRQLAADAGCDYCISPVDAAGAAYSHKILADGETFAVGKSKLRVLHTPGHTPGSTSFVLDEKYMFTGDAIMKSALGRPDLGGKVREWADLLFDTIHQRFRRIDDRTIVLPTHASSVMERDAAGAVSLTLGEARRKMELFSIRDRQQFADLIEKTLLENPARYQDIRMVNLGQSDPDEEKRKELETGKNLCGMAEKKG